MTVSSPEDMQAWYQRNLPRIRELGDEFLSQLPESQQLELMASAANAYGIGREPDGWFTIQVEGIIIGRVPPGSFD